MSQTNLDQQIEAAKQAKPKPVLTKEQKQKRRRRNRRIAAVTVILLLGMALGFMIGRAWPDRTEVSFYAVVLEKQADTWLVEGIAENDVNHRSQSYIGLDRLDKPGMAMDGKRTVPLEDVKVGDLVRIVYDGTVMESYPSQIKTVWRIEVTTP